MLNEKAKRKEIVSRIFRLYGDRLEYLLVLFCDRITINTSDDFSGRSVVHRKQFVSSNLTSKDKKRKPLQIDVMKEIFLSHSELSDSMEKYFDFTTSLGNYSRPFWNELVYLRDVY